MEQKTIDTIIEGRKIIDAIERMDISAREASTAAVRIAATEKSQMAVAREAEAASIAQAEKEIQQLGFTSIGEFMEFNSKMCFAAFCEVVEISGECDLCTGYKETPPCVIKYRDKACFHTQNFLPKERIMQLCFQAYLSGSAILDENSAGALLGGCPEGHGYHLAQKKGDYPFDLRWRPKWAK